MAKSSKRKPTLLVGLLIAAGLIGAYLSDCIPGFGGGGAGDADPAAAAEEAEEVEDPKTPPPAKAEADDDEDAEAQAATLQITVDGEKCRTAEGDVECTALCERTTKATRVEIDATLGAHGTVESLQKCLQTAGYEDVRVRSE